MSQPEITQLADGLEFPEGPVWMPDGTVYVTELMAGRITRVKPDGTKEVAFEPGGSPNGLAIGPDGALYVANSGGWDFYEVMGMKIPDSQQPEHYSGGRIERIDLASGDIKVLYTECDGNELVGPNDLVFDSRRRLLLHRPRQGSRPRANARRDLLRDGRRVVDPRSGVPARVAERCRSLARRVAALRGRDAHRSRVGVEPRRAGPARRRRPGRGPRGGEMICGLPGMQLFDSLAIDGEGNVVVATLVTGALSTIAPNGELLDQALFGDPMVTNVAFGGPDLTTAYVTCSATGRLVSAPWPRPGLKLAY